MLGSVQWILLGLGTLSLLAPGCTIDLGEAPFFCNIGGTECPDGYQCRESYGSSNVCVKQGSCPSGIKGCPTVAKCGNGKCEPGETPLLCPQDCSSTGQEGKTDGPIKKDGSTPPDQYIPPPDQYIPPPDQYVPPPDQPPPLGQFGDKCSFYMKCGPAFECIQVTASTAYCTKKCTNTLKACPGSPGTTFSACIIPVSSYYYCGFICRSGTTTYPCPATLKCGSSPNPPGSTQYLCE